MTEPTHETARRVLAVLPNLMIGDVVRRDIETVCQGVIGPPPLVGHKSVRRAVPVDVREYRCAACGWHGCFPTRPDACPECSCTAIECVAIASAPVKQGEARP